MAFMNPCFVRKKQGSAGARYIAEKYIRELFAYLTLFEPKTSA